ncbi:MAG: histidine phosphatase superfamily [Linnemannia gamsii]|nr:MAG: histidine phosphatase superfamily [Linnemannia gamsii]
MAGARLITIMLFLIAGGLVMTASRFRSSSQQQDLIALDLIDLFNQEQTDLSANPEGYNYCQAPRPTLETYPDPKVKGATLINSQLFIRHGDRAPISALPLDLDLVWDCSNSSAYTFTGPRHDSTEKSPYHYANVVAHQVVTIPAGSPFASKLMWKGNCAPGQLTPLGALQHRKLGAALRQIYVDKLNLLPEIYDADTVHIRSTDVWRTKQSAEHLMAGMYGVQGKPKSATHPVLKIHTLPTEIDYLTLNAGACPRISQLRSEIEKTSEVLKRLKDDNVGFSKQLTRILGAEKPWSGYMDTILPRICHNKPLQCREDGNEGGLDNCINETISNKILDNVAIQTTEMYRDAEGVFDVLRLGMGPLAGDIKDNLLAAKAQGRVRLSFYSGHDTTVLPLLGLFDAEDMRWPPYASNILVELWKTPQEEHFVRVLYNQAVLLTKSNWCNLEWCPLEAFVTHLDRFISKDLMSECQRQ